LSDPTNKLQASLTARLLKSPEILAAALPDTYAHMLRIALAVAPTPGMSWAMRLEPPVDTFWKVAQYACLQHAPELSPQALVMLLQSFGHHGHLSGDIATALYARVCAVATGAVATDAEFVAQAAMLAASLEPRGNDMAAASRLLVSLREIIGAWGVPELRAAAQTAAAHAEATQGRRAARGPAALAALLDRAVARSMPTLGRDGALELLWLLDDAGRAHGEALQAFVVRANTEGWSLQSLQETLGRSGRLEAAGLRPL
jgi:hypothetical protein